jgi:hypothetical protein
MFYDDPGRRHEGYRALKSISLAGRSCRPVWGAGAGVGAGGGAEGFAAGGAGAGGGLGFGEGPNNESQPDDEPEELMRRAVAPLRPHRPRTPIFTVPGLAGGGTKDVLNIDPRGSHGQYPHAFVP